METMQIVSHTGIELATLPVSVIHRYNKLRYSNMLSAVQELAIELGYQTIGRAIEEEADLIDVKRTLRECGFEETEDFFYHYIYMLQDKEVKRCGSCEMYDPAHKLCANYCVETTENKLNGRCFIRKRK